MPNNQREVQALRELEAIVCDMREAQRAYFRERTAERLASSKHLERQVDLKLRELAEQRSPGLF